MLEPTPTATLSTGIDTHPVYEVFNEIGRGNSATIYEGFDLNFERPVAIKQLRRGALRAEADAFKAEAKFLSGLSHPNIVHVYDYDGQRGWIVMELMRGSLAEQVRQGPLAADNVRDILRQSLRGLQCLHEKKKLHGEIKPGNLLIDELGAVKLCDTAGVDVNGEHRLPNDSQRHVAPEVLNSDEFGTPSYSVDLYCLGLVALELLTGAKFASLFKGVEKNVAKQHMAWAQWHASPGETLPPVKRIVGGVPNDLAAVIDGLLKKHVRERYASAADALAALGDSLLQAPQPQNADPAPAEIASVEPRRAVQVTRPPTMRRQGRVEEKVAVQNPFAAWSAVLEKFQLPKDPVKRKRMLLMAGAAVGLLLSLLAAAGPAAVPITIVRVDTVADNGEPVAATISIDGEPTGRSGEPIEVTPGRYEITCTPLAGSLFAAATTIFDLTGGESTLNVVLKRREIKALPPPGCSVVVSPQSEPPGARLGEAELWIDEIKRPVGQREFVLQHGPHQLRIELNGYEPHQETIVVSTNRMRVFPVLKQVRRSITLRVQPPDASVDFAGTPLAGTSPYHLEKQDGDYDVFVVSSGFEAVDQRLTISGNGTHQITLRRSPPIPQFPIRFETDPPGATVSIGELVLGPSETRYLLPSGRHQVRLQKPGYVPVSSWIDVDANSNFFFWYLDATEGP